MLEKQAVVRGKTGPVLAEFLIEFLPDGRHLAALEVGDADGPPGHCQTGIDTLTAAVAMIGS